MGVFFGYPITTANKNNLAASTRQVIQAVGIIFLIDHSVPDNEGSWRTRVLCPLAKAVDISWQGPLQPLFYK